MPNKGSQVNVINVEFQNALIRAILEAAPDGILAVDDQGIVVSYNRRFLEIWKFSSNPKLPGLVSIGAVDEPILNRVTELVRDSQTFFARVKELYHHPELDDHCEIELKDGRTLERHSSVLRGDNNQYLGRVWFFRDITDHKNIETELVKLTRHDALTGITNRRGFVERANHEFIRAKRYLTPLCIASIDIDHFKRVNDAYGHAEGDEVLKTLCSIIQRLLREIEMFARVGGEEFVILIPDTKLEGAVLLAERVRLIVAEHKMFWGDQEFSCTISIGVTALRETDHSIDDFLGRADKIMYRAKENGRNRVESEK